MADTGRRNPKYLRCSFCGKGRDSVRRLIAGPGVHICDECVSLCNEIIAGPPSPVGHAGDTLAPYLGSPPPAISPHRPDPETARARR